MAAHFNRGAAIDRLLGLVMLCQGCGDDRTLPPMADLAERFGVCKRTIQRDLAAIERRLPVRRYERAS